jgi:hypothetical protein
VASPYANRRTSGGFVVIVTGPKPAAPLARVWRFRENRNGGQDWRATSGLLLRPTSTSVWARVSSPPSATDGGPKVFPRDMCGCVCRLWPVQTKPKFEHAALANKVRGEVCLRQAVGIRVFVGDGIYYKDNSCVVGIMLRIVLVSFSYSSSNTCTPIPVHQNKLTVQHTESTNLLNSAN